MSALAGLVIHLEALRADSNLSMRELSRLAGRGDECHSWYRDLVTGRLSGPILERINAAAKVYGLRLALVPIEETEET